MDIFLSRTNDLHDSESATGERFGPFSVGCTKEDEPPGCYLSLLLSKHSLNDVVLIPFKVDPSQRNVDLLLGHHLWGPIPDPTRRSSPQKIYSPGSFLARQARVIFNFAASWTAREVGLETARITGMRALAAF